ncbi:MAG: hypothetical protein P8107_06415 [Spirochaetia bacterium]
MMKRFLILFTTMLFLCAALLPCFGAEQNSDGSPSIHDGLQFDKIFIALGLFGVISAAFFNWESRSKNKKNKKS